MSRLELFLSMGQLILVDDRNGKECLVESMTEGYVVLGYIYDDEQFMLLDNELWHIVRQDIFELLKKNKIMSKTT